MELALPELLSREDILRIFNQRRLHVHNMNELTLDELLRVYKMFVMPLSRRPERSKKIKQNFYDVYNNKNENHMQVEYSDGSCHSMDIDYVCDEICGIEQFRSSDRMSSPVGEKRRQRDSNEDVSDICKNDYQYQLSSVTKRIRINSLS